MESCRARHILAELLLESLQHEINNPEGSMLTLVGGSSDQPCVTLESVSDWAADRYGIGLPETIDTGRFQ
jgi:hypothetical protein